jgi:hypothetical protein
VASLVQHLLKDSMGRDALQPALGLKDRKSFRERYLQSALASELVEMTLPDKPNSHLQQYRLTDQGQRLLKLRNSGGSKCSRPFFSPKEPGSMIFYE